MGLLNVLNEEHKKILQVLAIINSVNQQEGLEVSTNLPIVKTGLKLLNYLEIELHHKKEDAFYKSIRGKLSKEKGYLLSKLEKDHELISEKIPPILHQFSNSPLSREKLVSLKEDLRNLVFFIHQHIDIENTLLYPLYDSLLNLAEQKNLETVLSGLFKKGDPLFEDPREGIFRNFIKKNKGLIKAGVLDPLKSTGCGESSEFF